MAVISGINWQVKPIASGEFNKSLSNLLVLRGKDLNQADCSAFHQRELYTGWLPQGKAKHQNNVALLLLLSVVNNSWLGFLLARDEHVQYTTLLYT